MASIKLLRTGQLMPQVGLGVWKIPKQQTADAVYNAIKTGYRLIDGACDYGNEAEAGQGIKRAIDEGIIKREDIFVTSKIWNSFHRREHVAEVARHQLKDWGLDKFDLLLVHFPCSIQHVPIHVRYPPEWHYDAEKTEIRLDNVPFQETWEAMEKLVDDGITTNIGVSNVQSALLSDIIKYARYKPQVLQVELHPYLTQEGLIAYAKYLGIAVTGYSNFAAEGWYQLGVSREKVKSLFDQEPIIKIAKNHQKTPAQIVLAWVVNQGVAIIPKTSSPTRLVENLNVTDIKLSDNDMKDISSLNINLRLNDPVGMHPGLCVFA